MNDDTWASVGEELRRVDPHRYLALLKVAEDICAIHRDPLGEKLAEGHFFFPTAQGDDLD